MQLLDNCCTAISCHAGSGTLQAEQSKPSRAGSGALHAENSKADSPHSGNSSSSPDSTHISKEEAKEEEAQPVKEHSSKGSEEEHAPHNQDGPAEGGHAGEEHSHEDDKAVPLSCSSCTTTAVVVLHDMTGSETARGRGM